MLWVGFFFGALIAYGPALEGSFLWDDTSHVTSPALQSVHGLWHIWFALGATQQYYPLLHTAFWIEHKLWGDAVLGYHLTNIALHVTAAFLLVQIMRRLTLPGAVLAGFIFTLHPVCVEAVAWISEQKTTLAAVFYLGAALVYLDFDQNRQARKYLLAGLFFILALLSKTVTAMLPAVLIVVLWWRRGRLEWRRDVVPLLPWFAIGVPAGLFTAWVERTFIGAQGPTFAFTFGQRILLAGRAMWFYAGKLIWPAQLCFSYPRWKLDTASVGQWLYPTSALAVLIGLALIARRHRGPLAVCLIFMGSLFPVLGFLNVLPFRYSFVADHFQYFASIVIIVSATAALVNVARHPRIEKTWKVVLALAMSLVCGWLTLRQSGMYTDLETLYRETLVRNPESWLAHNNLGLLLVQAGRVSDAIGEYTAAIQIEPDYPEAHFNLGSALIHSQMPDGMAKGITEYETALRLKPDYVEVHYNLGNALAQIPGRMPEAISQYQAALRIEPSLAAAHANLGSALTQTPGGLSAAVVEYETALRINPDLVNGRLGLANALSKTPGRLAEAIAQCEAALRIDPDSQPARELLDELKAARR